MLLNHFELQFIVTSVIRILTAMINLTNSIAIIYDSRTIMPRLCYLEIDWVILWMFISMFQFWPFPPLTLSTWSLRQTSSYNYVGNLILEFIQFFLVRKLNSFRYDLRIEFRDLNNVTSLNSLSYENCQSIWTPKIGFTNALGPYQTTVDDLTSGVLVKEATPLSEDITLSTEGLSNWNITYSLIFYLEQFYLIFSNAIFRQR